MKKIITSSICVAALALLFSCTGNNEFLKEDPKGMVTTENLMSNTDNMQLMINGLYWIWNRAMLRPYESPECKQNSADDRLGLPPVREEDGQCETNSPISAAGDGFITKGWERCWNVINQANSIINNAKEDDGGDNTKLHELVGQAHFIRAYTYLYLVRYFNNIPLVLTAYDPDKDRSLTVSPSSDVYELIVDDLKKAEEWLPLKYDNPILSNGGSVTRAAAKALLAKVYLQRAGFPCNGGNADYKLAMDKAKEVIDNAGTYGLGLYDHYYQLWDPYWKPNTHQGKEEVLLFMACDGTDDGYSVRSPNPSRPADDPFNGWYLFQSELYFFIYFPEGERKDFTFVTDYYYKEGGEVKHKTWQELQTGHPMYRKWWADDLTEGWTWDEKGPGGNWLNNMNACATWYNGRDIIMLRYADVLLTYAEAQCRVDGSPNAMAYDCLNQVRNRAKGGVGTTSESLSGLTAEQFLDAVVWERAYEFAGGEFESRWFDLIRLELVEKATTTADSAGPMMPYPPSMSKGWRYEPSDLIPALSMLELQKPYTKHDYFLDIPTSDATLNPNLKDNNANLR